MTTGVSVRPHEPACDGCTDHEPQGLRWTVRVGNTQLTICERCKDRLHRQTAPLPSQTRPVEWTVALPATPAEDN